ncbi:hypothetical protein EYM_06860 [Ignicoccus islandicus DSM 13165]|uniref:Uncharacterized protein n=1 Tax=Ignicoccus islandicus DSM 13165 TaxID=940295 RepID=A0A0U3DYS3_9CREN|nr:hypothetical protein [Ignicoccus islandicus]ALU12730.1 hypothetical protein EYM_06860 [Ignicoccus islandicus DSM 13165]
MLLKKANENNCFNLSKDASEDVVSFMGFMNDKEIYVTNARPMRAIEKTPVSVRTTDAKPEDLVTVHYHCGIAPSPSAIDIATMTLALKTQILATVPGRPRVFGIVSPTHAGNSLCLDLAIYEPVPQMTIGYDKFKVHVNKVVGIGTRKKGFAKVYRDGSTVDIDGSECTLPSKKCIPFRIGTTGEIVLEDFIFIASYYVNVGESEFQYLKLSPHLNVLYDVKVFNLDIEKAVIRGTTWTLGREDSTKGLNIT